MKIYTKWEFFVSIGLLIWLGSILWFLFAVVL
jgi:hypothetical protein